MSPPELPMVMPIGTTPFLSTLVNWAVPLRVIAADPVITAGASEMVTGAVVLMIPMGSCAVSDEPAKTVPSSIQSI